MHNFILLSLLLFPLIGSIILIFIKDKKIIQVVALGTAWITFILSIVIWILFDKSSFTYQFTFKYLLFSNISFHLGLDGISLFFILLTTFLIPICLLTGINTIKEFYKEYMISFLILETLLIGVFSILDLFLFYILFESILIPMFLIIGIWGSRERKIHAAYQFFIYTLIGSLLLLLAIIYIYYEYGSSNLEYILSIENKFNFQSQKILWIAFFASFAVKIPLIPFHIWLPEAHTEAPTAGSIILAGLLLKMGGYGFIRFSLSLFPLASIYFTPFIYTLSIISIIYASITTLRQIDLKKIIAYSSVAHMGFVTLGIFTNNIQGIEGSIFLMLSHGLVASALFYSIGLLYNRHHTRLLEYYGGLVHVMPLYSTLFLILTLANISFPGTSSFIGEFLVMIGLAQTNTIITVLAGLGIILGASYSLWLYNRLIFGSLKTIYIKSFIDLNRMEFFILILFISLIFIMGIFPNLFLDYIHASTLKF